MTVEFSDALARAIAQPSRAHSFPDGESRCRQSVHRQQLTRFAKQQAVGHRNLPFLGRQVAAYAQISKTNCLDVWDEYFLCPWSHHTTSTLTCYAPSC